MFEFLFFVTALYMGYVAYEAYAAVNRSEKGEPVMKPKAQAAPKTAPPKAPVSAKAPAEKKAAAKPAAAQKAPAATKAAPAPKAVKAAPTPAPKAPAAAPKPVAAKPAPAKPKAAPKAAPKAPIAAPQAPVTLAETLKNPETGETTPVPANYRFAKKWIKDALVAEKLLDRVYKPNELDGPASDKVKEAIDKLRALKKYQA